MYIYIMNYNLQKLKLYLLQRRYSNICKIISILQDHINILTKNNFIEYNDRNTLFNDLFEMTKILNSKYNEFINSEIDHNIYSPNRS